MPVPRISTVVSSYNHFLNPGMSHGTTVSLRYSVPCGSGGDCVHVCDSQENSMSDHISHLPRRCSYTLAVILVPASVSTRTIHFSCWFDMSLLLFNSSVTSQSCPRGAEDALLLESRPTELRSARNPQAKNPANPDALRRSPSKRNLRAVEGPLHQLRLAQATSPGECCAQRQGGVV